MSQKAIKILPAALSLYSFFSLNGRVATFYYRLYTRALFSVSLATLLFTSEATPSNDVDPTPVATILPATFPGQLPRAGTGVVVVNETADASFLFFKVLPMYLFHFFV